MPIIRIPQVADLDALPRYAGVPPERIVMPANPQDFAQAVQEISAFTQIGFDTESKPTFKVGEVSTGPHLVQFATPGAAYLFQMGVEGAVEAAKSVLESDRLLKIGFGLGSDRSRLRSRLGIDLRHFIDLGTTLRYQNKKGQVGLRGAVAAVLGARISKSRSVSTSNWANRTLTDAQRLYAANDAYAALEIFLALGDNPERLLADRIMPAREKQN